MRYTSVASISVYRGRAMTSSRAARIMYLVVNRLLRLNRMVNIEATVVVG